MLRPDRLGLRVQVQGCKRAGRTHERHILQVHAVPSELLLALGLVARKLGHVIVDILVQLVCHGRTAAARLGAGATA